MGLTKSDSYERRMVKLAYSDRPYARKYEFVIMKLGEIDGDGVLDGPVWCVQREARRRKKTIFATCPDCLRVNKLDRRSVLPTNVFARPGCFVCSNRECSHYFRPYLEGWRPDLLVIPKKPRKRKRRQRGDRSVSGVQGGVPGEGPDLVDAAGQA